MGATLSAPNDLAWRKKKCGGVLGAENELRRSGGEEVEEEEKAIYYYRF